MIDEILMDVIPENVKLVPIVLVRDKQIFLIRGREEDLQNKRSYVRTYLIMVGNEVITSNYADTKLLISEIKLFDKGNKQNKFTVVEKFDGDINLRLKLSKGHIYITRAEALAILDIYYDSKSGVGTQRILEFELKFTRQLLVKLLSDSGLLDKRIGR
ncbi:MAG: hypothetical protein QG567_1799 [Campylobacterota bacterium]|nr:hypothetical protein [Campylobacterota bacterium]